MAWPLGLGIFTFHILQLNHRNPKLLLEILAFEFNGTQDSLEMNQFELHFISKEPFNCPNTENLYDAGADVIVAYFMLNDHLNHRKIFHRLLSCLSYRIGCYLPGHPWIPWKHWKHRNVEGDRQLKTIIQIDCWICEFWNNWERACVSSSWKSCDNR